MSIINYIIGSFLWTIIGLIIGVFVATLAIGLAYSYESEEIIKVLETFKEIYKNM